MITIITRRFAALFAAALFVCALLAVAKVSHAQPPPPPCAHCFTDTTIVNPTQCQSGGPDTCFNCHTWGLVNHCDSCITQFIISCKAGAKFTPCCVGVDSVVIGWWVVTPIGPPFDSTEYLYTDTHGACLSNVAPHNVIQFTTCGITTGDVVYISWNPGNPSSCTMTQEEVVVVP
jgi:hypothetical protein